MISLSPVTSMYQVGLLDPAAIVALRDTREQIGLDLSPLQSIERTLPTGDYSCLGLEWEVAIEVKGSIEDLLTVVGRGRD